MLSLFFHIPHRWLLRVVILGLIIFATVFYREHLTLPASNLQIGDCFDAPTVNGPVSDLHHHPCTDSHTGEVYGVFVYPENAVSGTLGSTDGVLLSHCDAAFHTYTGATPAKRRDLTEGFIQPSAAGWKNGDRQITCFLSATSGKPTKRSEQQAAPTLLPNG